MKNSLFNLCSNCSGPYTPFRRARYNVFCPNEQDRKISLHDSVDNLTYSFFDFYEQYSNKNTDCLDGSLHVMYEPGRLYPPIPYEYFSSVVIRVGDIHHLVYSMYQTYLLMI